MKKPINVKAPGALSLHMMTCINLFAFFLTIFKRYVYCYQFTVLMIVTLKLKVLGSSYSLSDLHYFFVHADFSSCKDHYDKNL